MPPYLPARVPATGALRQCEILSNVVLVQPRLETVGTANVIGRDFVLPLALVLTQDCDLDQDFAVRFTKPNPASDKLIPSILLAEVFTAEDVLARYAEGSKKVWERLNIKNNKNERYQFLQAVPPGCDSLGAGLPELVIDFKRYFALPAGEVYRRVELGEAVRRAAFASPYLEHLAARFAAYHGRVALPEDHASA